MTGMHLTAKLKLTDMLNFIVCGTDGTVWVEDVKGVETQAFKIKQKMFHKKYPWMELKIIR